jgi:predicted nucleic acid-binding protein
MNNQILIDSSFLFAIFHNRDKNHLRAVEFNAKTTNAPLVSDITLPEVSFLFVRDLGYYAIGEFLAGLVATQIPLIGLNMIDIQRAHEIMQTYPDAKFDLVDTCIMALSERLQITKICTFDRRDFSIFRPKHCDYLELLP